MTDHQGEPIPFDPANMTDAEKELYARWEQQIADGVHDGGRCTACGDLIVNHPLPDRVFETKPEHCQAAAKRKKG